MKKFLQFIKAIGVAFHLSELKKFAQSLTDVPELAQFVNSRINDINNVVKLITDSDPDNKKQLRKLFDENREKLTDEVLLLAAFEVEKLLGETQPERAEYLANALREIAALDLFPVTEEKPKLAAGLENQFEKVETAQGKKGKQAKAFAPEEAIVHKLPETVESETTFEKVNNEAEKVEG